MKPIYLGLNANNKPLWLTEEMLKESAHVHVIGGSGLGKSKSLQSLMRQFLRNRIPFTLVDWPGSLYRKALADCGNLGVGIGRDDRELILLDPSGGQFITGFNPFANRGGDISVQVARRIDAVIRVWGALNTNDTPTLERTLRLLFSLAVMMEETLPNIAQLLNFSNRDLRAIVIERISDPYIRQQWQDLQVIKTFRDWQQTTGSTQNRLSRFLGSQTMVRFLGQPDRNLDLDQVIAQGANMLVNLGSSNALDRISAKAFAALLLTEFFESAMRRITQEKNPKPYFLILDEFHEYWTPDFSSMLDQLRKTRVHIIFAHQHCGHFQDDERLRKSVFTNARHRFIFGGLDFEDACLLANEDFLNVLNERQIKKAYYGLVHRFEEQTRLVCSHSQGRGTNSQRGWSSSHTSASVNGTGQGVGDSIGFMEPTEGWFNEAPEQVYRTQGKNISSHHADIFSDTDSESGSEGESEFESDSVTEVPVFVPIPVRQLNSETEWSRDEKVSKVAQMLKTQMIRHSFAHLGRQPTQPMRWPLIIDPEFSDEFLSKYSRRVHRRHHDRLPGEADQKTAESSQKFLIGLRQVLGPEQPSTTRIRQVIDPDFVE